MILRRKMTQCRDVVNEFQKLLISPCQPSLSVYRDTNGPVSYELRGVFTFYIVFTLNSCDISTILK